MKLGCCEETEYTVLPWGQEGHFPQGPSQTAALGLVSNTSAGLEAHVKIRTCQVFDHCDPPPSPYKDLRPNCSCSCLWSPFWSVCLLSGCHTVNRPGPRCPSYPSVEPGPRAILAVTTSPHLPGLRSCLLAPWYLNLCYLCRPTYLAALLVPSMFSAFLSHTFFKTLPILTASTPPDIPVPIPGEILEKPRFSSVDCLSVCASI